jgi:hypothetical protein
MTNPAPALLPSAGFAARWRTIVCWFDTASFRVLSSTFTARSTGRCLPTVSLREDSIHEQTHLVNATGISGRHDVSPIRKSLKFLGESPEAGITE